MAAGSSEDECTDSNHDLHSPASNSEGQSTTTSQRQSRQNVRAQERSVSRSRRLGDEADLMVETSARQPRERKSRSGPPSQRKSRSRQSSAGRSETSQSEEKIEGTLTTEYRDLLNDMIADASSQSITYDPALGTSQLGMSTWSAQEKSTLFEALEKHGAGDLPRLTRAVRTKSQYEIQGYLSLLQKGLAMQNNSAPQKGILLNDIPASVEVAVDCEVALNAAADALSSRVEKQEQLAARTKLGDDWLIDKEAAEAEDQSYDQALAAESEVVKDVPTSDDERLSSDHAHLLRSSAFLQLSRNIFMNNCEHKEWNWHHIDLITDASDEPAIFRRAWENLHALTISLTRRLVQASIFQAMTRLRASDSTRADWTPLAAVREIDVRSAMELLNMGPDWHDYWARVARSCRLSVLSDSKKYNDGRAGTKVGFPITYEEVETELGLDRIDGAEQETGVGFEEPDQNDFMADSDAYTDAAEDSCDDGDAAGASRESKVEGFGSMRKRKRPLSPRSFACIEDESAEYHDQILSAQEQTRLWQKLRLEPPQSLVDASMATQRPLPAPPGHNSVPVIPGWRGSLEYQSAWESELGTPDLRDFQGMAFRGRSGQKRRRMVQEELLGSSHPQEDGISDGRDLSRLAEPSEDGGVDADEFDSADVQTQTESETEEH